ncbi:AAA family ATPase [Kosakonia oryzendophytica]|uniref:AAA family ATPase n=1 Tax=Kosakonia oryzendophytica TaxID=1005665 RepID=UPI003D34521F
MLGEHLEIEGLIGVGQVNLELESSQHIYTFIGANGVGKTKMLEALFQIIFFNNSLVHKSLESITAIPLRFKSFSQHSPDSYRIQIHNSSPILWMNARDCFPPSLSHHLPVVFLGAQSRGLITKDEIQNTSLGGLESRRKAYFQSLTKQMESAFGSMNMSSSIQEWFVSIARSSNRWQKREDNREVEISTVIRLLHEIDERIDPEFLEVGGDDRVCLKIDGQVREISQLSSGFTSILKLIQAIISGYSYFTNESNIQKIKGIVLIDEIESHLHLSWQANIIPLLKRLFPNTTFYITTHSSVVLAQLKEGEAYNLYRDNNGVVKTRKITAPNKAALADILKDVFSVDINQMKLQNSSVDEQLDAKTSLLGLLKKQEKQ